jgi:hypothetical protein
MKWIILLLTFVLVPLVSSAFLGTFTEDRCVELTQVCDNCTYVNITSVRANFTNEELVSNVVMTQDAEEYNYTFCLTNNSGTYTYTTCGDLNGFTNCESVDFIINPQGIESTEQRTNAITRSIYFLFIIGILLFIGFLFVKNSKPVRWTMFIFAIIFFLSALNVLSISLTDEVVNPNLESFFEGFTVIAFYFYWFAAGLLIIIWMFTFINTWIFRKNLRNAQKYGLA